MDIDSIVIAGTGSLLTACAILYDKWQARKRRRAWLAAVEHDNRVTLGMGATSTKGD